MTENRVIEFRELAEGEKVDGSTIVDNGLPAVYNFQLNEFRNKGESPKLLLVWQGSNVPRGIQMPNGIEIGGAQNGMLAGTDYEQLGYYERREECAGPNQDRHVMIITPFEC